MKKFVRKTNLEEQKLALRAEYDFIVRGAFRMLKEEDVSKETKIEKLKRDYYQIAGEDVQRNELFYERLEKIKMELQEKTRKKVNEYFFNVLGLFLDARILSQTEYDELRDFQKTKAAIKAHQESTKQSLFSMPELIVFEIEKLDKDKTIANELMEFIKSKTENEESLKVKGKVLELIDKEIYSKIKFEKLNEHAEWSLSLYGSFVNQFSIQTSDIDVSLDVDGYDDYDEKAVLKHFISQIPQKFKESKNIKIVPFEDSMRIPVLEIKFKDSGLQISFSVMNVLGVINSKMIKTYSEIDPRCRLLGILVKLWAAVHKLNSAKDAFLSSYAYNLMVINYLQTMKDPILPSLQAIRKADEDYEPEIKQVRNHEKGLNPKETYKVRVDYEDDMEVIKEYMRENGFKENKKTTVQLLKGFFKFYKNKKKFEKITLSVKEGIHRERKEDSHEQEYLYSIEDPFDIKHNPGKYLRAKHFNSEKMLRCMRQSYRLLKEKKVMNLFKPFDDE